MTLRARLALWAALATGLAVLLVAGGLYWAVSGFLRQAQIDRLRSAASAVQGHLEGELRRQEDEFADLMGYQLSQVYLNRLRDLDPNTRTLELRVILRHGQAVQTARFPAAWPIDSPPGAYLTRDRQRLIVVLSLLGQRGLLQIVTDTSALNDAQRAFARALTWLLPLALLLSLGVGWTVAGRLLRPVRSLERAAQDIKAAGDLRRPLPGAGSSDELSRLALTLQHTFTHLAESREREQAFLRAAAHDLRSPLAALQARVDGTLARERDSGRYQRELREVGQDIGRLSTLANHLLLLAREPEALERRPVMLRELCAAAVDRARELAPEADIDLLAPQDCQVLGDRVLLGQAIWNLTVNAVRHAPQATIIVKLQCQEGQVQVEIHDDGPGVAPEVLIRLGEAFYRPDESRSGEGHGLGLALARRAAELHGGCLELASRPGEGFQATLVLNQRNSEA